MTSERPRGAPDHVRCDRCRFVFVHEHSNWWPGSSKPQRVIEHRCRKTIVEESSTTTGPMSFDKPRTHTTADWRKVDPDDWCGLFEPHPWADDPEED